MKQWILWNQICENKICILRVFASEPQLELPEIIEHKPVFMLSSYCFAKKCHIPDDFSISTFEDETPISTLKTSKKNWQQILQKAEQTKLHEFSSTYIQAIVLPDSLARLGAYCFYDCKNLKSLSISSHLNQIDSDAFMNCYHLKELWIRSPIEEPNGLRQLLVQVSWKLEVIFQNQQEQVEAKLLFPEYFETYDEIAPAHLFGKNISGEGFRARQCFHDDVIDLTQYDSIFPKICTEETEETSAQIALFRLLYPKMLSETAKDLYITYLANHELFIGKKLMESKKLSELLFLFNKKYLSINLLKNLILYAADLDWPEGSGTLMNLLHQKNGRALSKKRYSFDDFNTQ